jgi:hypothetical protein
MPVTIAARAGGLQSLAGSITGSTALGGVRAIRWS